jgi:ribonuclease D
MAAIVLGHRVSKAQRLSNWEATTLTPQQQMYAATDAWVCISIYEKLLSVKPLTELKIEEVRSESNTAKSEETHMKRAEHRRRRPRHRKPQEKIEKQQ